MQGERARAAGVAAVSLITMVAVAATHQVQAAPRTHRLEVTPGTVAYGYYWSEARPALRIESGDVIDVDTLLSNISAIARVRWELDVNPRWERDPTFYVEQAIDAVQEEA